MRIGSSTGSFAANQAAGMNNKKDPQMEGIQKQIRDVQDQIKKLESDKNVPNEMKEKKKKELEQNLQNLQNELSQRKLEIQKEAKAKEVQQSQPVGTKADEKKAQAGTMDAGTMQGVIYAGSSLKELRTVKSVQDRMEGKANVLKSEIKLDAARGGNTELKEEELADLEKKSNAAGEMLGQKVAESNQTVSNKTEAKNKDKEKEEEEEKEEKKKEEESKAKGAANGTDRGYHPIDLYL